MTTRFAFFLAGVSVGFLGLGAWAARLLNHDLPYEFGGKA